MRTRKWVGVGLMLAGALVLQSATTVSADHGIASDRAAAILVYPNIRVDSSLDTVVQVSNTSTETVNLHCFYIDATSHCSVSQESCDPISDPCSATEGLCLPGWIETDFMVVLTPRQPLAWLASDGLAGDDVPLDGILTRGPRGESNAGTHVPPVAEVPFWGELKCIVVDNEGRAVAKNSVKGEATHVDTLDEINVDKLNAIGIQAIEGDANADNRLELGGGSNEYNGCPNVLIMDHFFDFAVDPVSDDPIMSQLTLVPCNEDLLNQIPGGAVVQYLVFNEFEQRFSTSTPIQCYFQRNISDIDTRNPERSIFSVYVAGTLTGQTRMRGVGGGILGTVDEFHGEDFSAAFNINMQGERSVGDAIVLP